MWRCFYWFGSKVKIKNSQNIDNPLQQKKYRNYCPRLTRVYQKIVVMRGPRKSEMTGYENLKEKLT